VDNKLIAYQVFLFNRCQERNCGQWKSKYVFFEFKTYKFFTLFRNENYGASIFESTEHIIFLEDHAAFLKE